MKLGHACSLFLLAALLVAARASAAAIDFGPATTISGDSDVDNSGTLVHAYFWSYPADDTMPSPITINGVPFINESYGSGVTPSLPGILLSGMQNSDGMTIGQIMTPPCPKRTVIY